jgi:RNA polymerase sigma-70 factor (sigma-E family)
MEQQPAPGEATTASSPWLAAWDFESWYRREYRRVLAYAISLTGNVVDAEDIVQEAFAAAHRDWEDLSNHPNPGGWIRRVVLNRSTSRLRRLAVQRRFQHLFVRRDVTNLAIPDDDVWRAVRRLPRQQAHAVALHYLEDLPVAEIAEILDCSPGSVKTHLSRGRAALRRELDDDRGSRR